jgi:site-specific recombinase XerD
VIDLARNPLLQYLARLAPSSQLTMRYILQDAADRLGFVDADIADVPWHHLEPGHVIALVAALRADGYAPNTSSLYVNAVRGVMNEAWRLGLIEHEQLLKIREIKPASGSRLPPGRNLRRSLIRELMEVCAADPRPQGVRDAAILALLYGTGMRKSESVDIDLGGLPGALRAGAGQGQPPVAQVRPGLGLRQALGLARTAPPAPAGRRA